MVPKAVKTKKGSRPLKFFSAGVLSLIVIWGSGCAWMVAAPQDQGNARAVLERLSANNHQLHSFKGLLKVAIKTETNSVSGRVALAAVVPDHIRLEWLSPLGQPLSSLAGNGETVTVLSHQDKKHHRFEQTPTALKPLINVPIGVEDLLELLSGRPVLPDFSAAQIMENPGASAILLKNRWNRTVADLELDVDGRLVAQRIYDANETVRYSVFWKRWLTRGVYTIPSQVDMASSGESVAVVVDRFWPDVDLAPATFELPVPNP
jgi:outer membrane biogenesis lipoprotein LolB